MQRDGAFSMWMKQHNSAEWHSSKSGVFNLSDNADHINNFNDAHGPLFKILIVFTYHEPDSYYALKDEFIIITIIIIIIGLYIFVKYQMHSVLCKFRKHLTIQNTAV